MMLLLRASVTRIIGVICNAVFFFLPNILVFCAVEKDILEIK